MLQNYIALARSVSRGVLLDVLRHDLRMKFWNRRQHIRVSYGGRQMAIRVRPGSTDAEVVWQCFESIQYEVPTVPNIRPHHRNAILRHYRSILEQQKIPLIIDCGANIGASTLWFHMRYPGSRIVAVEPAPDNFNVLHENCRGLGNICPRQAAVGPQPGAAFLQDTGGGGWGYRVGANPSSTHVQVMAVEQILRECGIDNATPFILKVDIEGAERELFEGNCHAIGEFPLVIVEPHDFMLPASGTALPFFKFHTEAARDFMFGAENIFSIDMRRLSERAGN